LHKVVVDVCDRRTADLEIHIVIVFSTTMAGGNHRMGIEIDAADKRTGRLQPSVDEPKFLMLAEAGMRANADIRCLLLQQRDMRGRPPKRVGAQMGGRIIGPPEEHPNIESALARSCQHLKERTTTIGHLKGGPEKGDGDPHPRLGLINGITNPAKCRLAINERVDAIASTDRVSAGGDKRNMSHTLFGCADGAGEPHVWTHR
jgi:hypothetical protein